MSSRMEEYETWMSGLSLCSLRSLTRHCCIQITLAVWCHQWKELEALKKIASHPSHLLQVIRIQPDEAIYLKINNKIPGLGLRLDSSKLDLTYKARYNTHLPDAYERLILDVVNGDKRLFIRNDELEAAWALSTPILKVHFLISARKLPFFCAAPIFKAYCMLFSVPKTGKSWLGTGPCCESLSAQ